MAKNKKEKQTDAARLIARTTAYSDEFADEIFVGRKNKNKKKG